MKTYPKAAAAKWSRDSSILIELISGGRDATMLQTLLRALELGVFVFGVLSDVGHFRQL